MIIYKSFESQKIHNDNINKIFNERLNFIIKEFNKSWDFEIIYVKKGLAKYDEDGNIVLLK